MTVGTSRPSVGVVMPVRNGAATIEAAARSVLEQHPPVDRVVVVDGASVDRTLDRLPTDPRIAVVHQRHGGLGAARNDGLDALDTDLVGFCDADDRWRPDALATRLEHLAINPDCAAVAGRVRTVADESTTVPLHRRAGLGAITDGYTPGAVLIRRAAVEAFDDDLRIATDSLWLARLLDSPHRVDLIDDVVLDKAVGADTLSTDLAAYQREMMVVVRELVERRRARQR